ncbi:DUF819 family protein [candidate division KSB1 bacterium]|nr:DUF819 family protein [candidate division KSB1 bacterium]NIR70083.1 DUF819 family protein [candidate division KSB1 bacterium]NIS24433.1 DUF819 family protein [candidate division KSB1 bacterium]NIT71369.1 DUF819 family protein [candidate division KSB1 bacterium]NIU25048.1 DUF819 family protein [candidate division KSB1 bacterium]
MDPLFTNDAIVLGILIGILALVFRTSHSSNPFWQKFYTYVPSLLLCYFIPSLFNSLGIISDKTSNLYFVSSRYLLPASLVLLTLSIDLKRILSLGPKAVIMFFAGTAGIMIGGPLAIIIYSLFAPEVVGGTGADAVWRGLTTVAGSWIGGGANQTAMKEVFQVGDKLFSAMVTVDVIVANVWMAFLLYGAGISERVDSWFKADASAIKDVQQRIEDFRARIARIPDLADVTTVLAVGFGITAIGHFGANLIAPWIEANAPSLEKYSLASPFFWLVVIATTGGLILSFTKARELEGVGASRYGSLLLYVLVASIGMKMDILAIFENPQLFLVGFIWILTHVIILFVVAKIIKAPFFFIAVGSQANVGGAASAPIVASAFHPALAPVGVLLAVLGYALGTYGAWLCGIAMQAVAP